MKPKLFCFVSEHILPHYVRALVSAWVYAASYRVGAARMKPTARRMQAACIRV